jgi:hypothetical protein
MLGCVEPPHHIENHEINAVGHVEPPYHTDFLKFNMVGVLNHPTTSKIAKLMW